MRNFIVIMMLFAVTSVSAQEKYITRSAKISFHSKTDIENIEAVNNKSTSVMDAKSGQMEFAVLMKGFEFEKELMMEHFNENYVESDKFPKSTFKGTISNIAEVNLQKDGSYPVKIKGDLTIHGVTNNITTDGTLEVKGGKVTGKSSFDVLLADYNISIPNVVKDNISKSVKIDIIAPYEKMNL